MVWYRISSCLKGMLTIMVYNVWCLKTFFCTHCEDHTQMSISQAKKRETCVLKACVVHKKIESFLHTPESPYTNMNKEMCVVRICLVWTSINSSWHVLMRCRWGAQNKMEGQALLRCAFKGTWKDASMRACVTELQWAGKQACSWRIEIQTPTIEFPGCRSMRVQGGEGECSIILPPPPPKSIKRNSCLCMSIQMKFWYC